MGGGGAPVRNMDGGELTKDQSSKIKNHNSLSL